MPQLILRDLVSIVGDGGGGEVDLRASGDGACGGAARISGGETAAGGCAKVELSFEVLEVEREVEHIRVSDRGGGWSGRRCRSASVVAAAYDERGCGCRACGGDETPSGQLILDDGFQCFHV